MSIPTIPRERVADRLLDDDRVLPLVEGAVHHQDQPGAHLRVLEARPVEPADGGHDDVVEVALAAAVSLHRVEAQLERRDPLRAVGAADRRVHRALDRERARLDQLRPVVDRVERVQVGDAARVGDGDEPVELPVVLDRERDALLVRDATRGSPRPPTRRGGCAARRGPLRTRVEHNAPAALGSARMKVGIVVPFSWSFWGAVLEHAELKSEALRARGPRRQDHHRERPARHVHARAAPAARPPRRPAAGRDPGRPHGDRAGERLAAEPRASARSVPFRLKRVFARGAVRRPAPARADDAGDLRLRRSRVAKCALVATWHAAGELDWMRFGLPFWGFLLDRIDHRIAVSDAGARSRRSAGSRTGLRGDPERRPDPAGGRPGEPRELDRLHRPPRPAQGDARAAARRGRTSTGAPARGCGSSAPTRSRCGCCSRGTAIPHDGIDVLGFLPQEELTAELLRAKALAAPSIGQESFGMVLTRAFACAVPVVASDIPGYRGGDDRATPACSSRRATTARSPRRSSALLEDEPRRRRLGEQRAQARDRALLVGHDRRAARADLPRGRGRVKVLRHPAVAVDAGWDRARLPQRGRRAALVRTGRDWADFRDAFTVRRVGVGRGRDRASTSSPSSRARSRGRP